MSRQTAALFVTCCYSSSCTGGLMMREPPSLLQPPVDLSLYPLSNSLKKLVACSCCVVNTLNLFDIIPMRKLIHSSFCSRAVQSSDLRFVKARTRSSLWITVHVELGQFLCSCVSLLCSSIYLCSVHVEDPSNSPPLVLYQQMIFTICNKLQYESGSFMLYSLPAQCIL